MQKIEHEIVAKRYWLEAEEHSPDIVELKECLTAIPLCNVIDWEELQEFHDEAPNLTAVMLPTETKFIGIPFKKFHGIMKKYRQNGREERRWIRFN